MYDRTEDDGIRITDDFLKGSEVETPQSVESVRLDLPRTSRAAYDVVRNAILIGPVLIDKADETGFVKATFRHEQSHGLMSNLKPSDQQELVDSICDDPNNMRALATFMFWFFKNPAHPVEAYTSDSPMINKFFKNGEDNGRGYFSKNVKRAEYHSKVYSLSMVGVVDEFLAYQATRASHDERFFSKEEGSLQLKAADALDKLNPEARGIIKRLGFENIRGKELTQRFYEELPKMERVLEKYRSRQEVDIKELTKSIA